MCRGLVRYWARGLFFSLSLSSEGGNKARTAVSAISVITKDLLMAMFAPTMPREKRVLARRSHYSIFYASPLFATYYYLPVSFRTRIIPEKGTRSDDKPRP